MSCECMKIKKQEGFFSYQKEILIILWGLLFTKCFVFEYLVQTYAVPVNSILYIWAPSIVMAAVATVVFLRIRNNGILISFTTARSTRTWGGLFVLALVILTVGFYLTLIESTRIPAYLGLLLGLGYGLDGLRTKDWLDWLPGLGWWLGAILIFQLNSIAGLQIFAFCIVLFTVLPMFLCILRGVSSRDAATGHTPDTF